MFAFAAAALAGTIWLGCAAADQTVEFDFPPELFPIVFAVQNFPAAEPLALYIPWHVGKLGDTSGRAWVDGGLISIKLIGEDAEGHFSLAWSILAHNCTSPNRLPDGSSGFNHDSYIYFRLEKGAKQPNFAAATSDPESCATIEALEFNVTGTQTTAAGYDKLDRHSCATLGELGVWPAASPCALKIDESQASSISASITASRCEKPHQTKPAFCQQPMETNATSPSLVRGMATVVGVAPAISLWIFHGVS
ncbi:hypothetical protein PG994_012757 [Apiospora phragmitis]|uniref:DUF7136 domain-containing protein n=1 Tax=Apiospora phragmitis TaxID=2905665 RepID=A0ABR1TBC9_9PEZI